jgi:hypothetical protein
LARGAQPVVTPGGASPCCGSSQNAGDILSNGAGSLGQTHLLNKKAHLKVKLVHKGVDVMSMPLFLFIPYL